MAADPRRLLTAINILNWITVAAPIVGLTAMVLYRTRGSVAAGAATVLVVDGWWIALQYVLDYIRRVQTRQLYIGKARARPAAHVLATHILPLLAAANDSRRSWRVHPRWITAYFLTDTVFGSLQPIGEWRYAQLAPDPRRRQALQERNSAYLEWLREKAITFENAVTETEYLAVITAIRDDLRRCLAADLGFLDGYEPPDPRRAWWKRIARNVLPAAALGTMAVCLPLLPGVTASGATLVGAQAGLAVAAVLTLVNTPSEVQKTISDSLKAASSHVGK